VAALFINHFKNSFMAKKKSHKKKHHRRRHVGALALSPSSPLVMLGSVAIGYFAGTGINSAINMLIPASMKTQQYTGKAVAAGQVGLGALLVLSKGKKTLVKTIAGGLLAGAGVKRAMIVFAPGTTDTLGGYGQVPVLGAYTTNGQLGRRVNGYGQVPVVGQLGAYNPPSSLTGASKVMGNCSNSGYGSSYGSAYMG